MIDLKKKNNEEMYAVAEPSWFSQHTKVVSAPEDNGDVSTFLLEQAEGTDIEDEYKAWLKEHEEKADCYFAICVGSDECYAVAYEDYGTAAYAIELTLDDNQ